MSKLFGTTKLPKPEETPIAPIPDDETDRIKRERSYSRKYGNRGREGTVLSNSGLG